MRRALQITGVVFVLLGIIVPCVQGQEQDKKEASVVDAKPTTYRKVLRDTNWRFYAGPGFISKDSSVNASLGLRYTILASTAGPIAPSSTLKRIYPFGLSLEAGGLTYASHVAHDTQFSSIGSEDHVTFSMPYEVHLALIGELPHGRQRTIIPEAGLGLGVTKTRIDYTSFVPTPFGTFTSQGSVENNKVAPYFSFGLHLFPDHLISLVLDGNYIAFSHENSVLIPGLPNAAPDHTQTFTFPSSEWAAAAKLQIKFRYYENVLEPGTLPAARASSAAIVSPTSTATSATTLSTSANSFLGSNAFHPEYHYLFAMGGLTDPLSTIGTSSYSNGNNDQKIGKTGPGIGLQYLYQAPTFRYWLLGVETFYHDFGTANVTSLLSTFYAPSGVDVSYKQLDFHLLARRNLGNSQFTMPYFILGPGFSSGHLVISGLVGDPHFLNPTTLVDSTSLAFSGVLGVGLDQVLENDWVLGAEARLTLTAGSSYSSTQDGEFWGLSEINGRTTAASFLLRLGHRFEFGQMNPSPTEKVEPGSL